MEPLTFKATDNVEYYFKNNIAIVRWPNADWTYTEIPMKDLRGYVSNLNDSDPMKDELAQAIKEMSSPFCALWS